MEKVKVSEYEIQANNFLKECNTTFTAEFVKHGLHFADDNQTRDIYKLTITRGKRSVSFMFGQSIAHSKGFGKYYSNTRIKPNAYDLLASLQKYEVGTFEDFCSDFGYDTDSRKAEKTYHAVKEEYNKVCTLFNADELERMQEIQ